jgi:TetR/AcrR family transcriptional repressor of nem operon
MRYSADHNEQTRERILDIAARLFREEGIAAVGLAKIMNEAGLTNGTFYTHFKSKEALVREALLRSLDARHEEIEQLLQNNDAEALIRAYLSPEHRDDPGTGCVVAALASEVSRHPRATRQTFATHSARTLDAIAASVLSRRGKKASREDAAVFMGLLSGTLQIARATPDRDESDAMLEAGIQSAIRLLK